MIPAQFFINSKRQNNVASFMFLFLLFFFFLFFITKCPERGPKAVNTVKIQEL